MEKIDLKLVNNQPPNELNKDSSKSIYSLNEFGDGSNETEIKTTEPQETKPSSFETGEQHIVYGGLDVHLTCCSPLDSINLFIDLYNYLQNKNKSKPNYT